MEWQPIETAPKDTPVLIEWSHWFDGPVHAVTVGRLDKRGDWLNLLQPRIEYVGYHGAEIEYETCVAHRWAPIPLPEPLK